jgi:hypothetical protein
MPSIFDNRKPAFGEGFLAFFDGIQSNPYKEDGSDREFIDHREWQHGHNVAYLYNQAAVEEDERQRLEAAGLLHQLEYLKRVPVHA